MKKVNPKRAAAIVAAMAMTFSGMGGIVPVFVETSSVLVASAAETITITPSKYGMRTPAKGRVVRNGKIVKVFKAEEFETGFDVSVDENTDLILNYEDGDLTFEALSGKLKSCTRESGVTRELFEIDVENGIKDSSGRVRSLIAKGSDSTTAFTIITTERNAETGDRGKYVSATNFASADNWYSGATLYDPKTNELKVKKLTYNYIPGEDVFVVIRAGGGNGWIGKLDIESGEAVTSFSSLAPTIVPLDMENFPRAKGAVSVKVSGSFLRNANTDYGETNTDADGNSYTAFDAEELATGNCKVSYIFNCSFALYNCARLQFDMGDGNTVEYLLYGNIPVLNADTRPPATIETNPKTGAQVVDATEMEEGKPVLSKKIVGTEDRDSDYSVDIYEGTRIYDTIAGVAYEKGEYCIKGYNPQKNYYIKVWLDANGDDAEWFKLIPVTVDDTTKFTWEKRVNTKETPEYTLPLSISQFPNEFAEGEAILLPDETVTKWTAEEFGTSKKEVKFDTKNGLYYKVNFRYGDGTNTYTIVGVDPELETEGSAGFAGEDGKGAVNIPIEANPGDEILITGKGYIGTPPQPVPVEVVYIVPEEDDASVKLPVGEYEFADKTTGLKDTVNTTTEPDKVPNLTTPIVANSYAVTTPDGKPVESGSLKTGDTAFDNTGKLQNPDSVKNGVYWGYTFTYGTKNAIDPESLTNEEGYFAVKDDGTFEKFAKDSVVKGDVNLDGNVDVKDVVLLQKYLLNTASFTTANFINADMDSDGAVDVFDIGLLKKALLSK